MSVGHRIVRIGGWTAALLAVLVAAYILWLRPWHRTWGATGAEAGRPMPGDTTVAGSGFVATRAVTIDAPPDKVWPWLAQMGRGRAGFYSYDRIVRALGIQDGPSAAGLLPGRETIAVGDEIPAGVGPGAKVLTADAGSSLVWEFVRPGAHLTWSWLLSPYDEGQTRLILRIRGRLGTPGLGLMGWILLDPAEFVLVHRLLGGIKARAEGRSQTPAGELYELSLWAAAALIGLAAWIAAFLRARGRWPFLVAVAAAALFLLLVFRQPSPVFGTLFDLLLLAALVLVLRFPRRGRVFVKAPPDRV
jgi:hypothetical protein